MTGCGGEVNVLSQTGVDEPRCRGASANCRYSVNALLNAQMVNCRLEVVVGQGDVSDPRPRAECLRMSDHGLLPGNQKNWHVRHVEQKRAEIRRTLLRDDNLNGMTRQTKGTSHRHKFRMPYGKKGVSMKAACAKQYRICGYTSQPLVDEMRVRRAPAKGARISCRAAIHRLDEHQ